ncbi:MAG: C10 family peptidase [Paludibacteraceae bacterium]|nr:C10 family peptidase [Paludibacteraceae bacterium]
MNTTIRLATIMCCSVMLCILCYLPCYAQERSLDEVADSAIAFFANMNNTPVSSKNASQSRMKSEMDIRPITRSNTTYLYSVNLPNGGWALVSNERQYKTVIGYGFDGPFDTDPSVMPPALNDLLNHHMNMIDSLRQDGVDVFNSKRSAFRSHVTRSSIYTLGDSLLNKNGEYMLWEQSGNYFGCTPEGETDPCCTRVYNKFCPTNHDHGCGHTWAGCGAVAMGQLMNYWGWPNQAEIPDTITNQFFCLCGVPSSSKHTHYYDWEHMPAKITTTTDLYAADNIAKLLRDCGYAAQTYYTDDGSAAMMEKIDVAMRETFRYHATYVVERPSVDVASMIKTDIDALRPVISQAWKWEAGSDPAIHTFLIDGYKNNDMYHINWGWGYSYDQWYDLGFDGYTGFRNFLTEIYPDCEQLADVIINPDTTINSGENMVLYAEQIYLGGTNHNLTITDGGYLLAEASDSIVLRTGFHAENGSCVHLRIRDFCDATGSYIRQAPNRIVGNMNDIMDDDNSASQEISAQLISDACLNISPNPVNTILYLQTNEELAQVNIYNLNGQCVMQTAQTDVDVSALPQGMYILRTETISGTPMQAKFIKQ